MPKSFVTYSKKDFNISIKYEYEPFITKKEDIEDYILKTACGEHAYLCILSPLGLIRAAELI